MKRIILALLILVLWTGTSFAAMVCNDAGTTASREGQYRVSVLCTFDTTPGTAVSALPKSIMEAIEGAFIFTFATVPGSTGPTDDSDLQILNAEGVTIVSATGNGADVIDETTITSVIYGDGPTAGSTNHYPLADTSVWTVTVTNNAVNSSSFTLIIQMGG